MEEKGYCTSCSFAPPSYVTVECSPLLQSTNGQLCTTDTIPGIATSHFHASNIMSKVDVKASSFSLLKKTLEIVVLCGRVRDLY